MNELDYIQRRFKKRYKDIPKEVFDKKGSIPENFRNEEFLRNTLREPGGVDRIVQSMIPQFNDLLANSCLLRRLGNIYLLPAGEAAVFTVDPNEEISTFNVISGSQSPNWIPETRRGVHGRVAVDTFVLHPQPQSIRWSETSTGRLLPLFERLCESLSRALSLEEENVLFQLLRFESQSERISTSMLPLRVQDIFRESRTLVNSRTALSLGIPNLYTSDNVSENEVILLGPDSLVVSIRSTPSIVVSPDPGNLAEDFTVWEELSLYLRRSNVRRFELV